jgi:hypothetical protein
MAVENPPALSLLTAYRDRAPHLDVLLAWLARVREAEGFADFELIVAEGDTAPRVAERVAAYEWARYVHVPMSGVFNKSVLLNRAARLARGRFFIIFDVDLLPAEGVLARHLSLAQSAPHLLFAGYRVQLVEMPAADALPTARALKESLDDDDPRHICPEDDRGPVLDFLLGGVRWGVCPCQPAAVFRAVGGMHEEYVGWGPEDEDIFERVCAQGLSLVRSYDLLYFHLPHDRRPDWHDPELVAANRRRIAERRRAWGHTTK